MYSPVNPMQEASGPLPWSQINGCLSDSWQPSPGYEGFRSPLLFDSSETSVDLQTHTGRAGCQITDSSPHRRWRLWSSSGVNCKRCKGQRCRVTTSARCQRIDLCSVSPAGTGPDSWPPVDHKTHASFEKSCPFVEKGS